MREYHDKTTLRDSVTMKDILTREWCYDTIPREVWSYGKSKSTCMNASREAQVFAIKIMKCFFYLVVQDMITKSYKFQLPWKTGGQIYIVKLYAKRSWAKAAKEFHSNGRFYSMLWRTTLIQRTVHLRIRLCQEYRKQMSNLIKTGYHYWQK